MGFSALNPPGQSLWHDVWCVNHLFQFSAVPVHACTIPDTFCVGMISCLVKCEHRKIACVCEEKKKKLNSGFIRKLLTQFTHLESTL